jgi:formate hydrogenlyase subunit 4
MWRLAGTSPGSAAGLALAFLVPYVFADTLGVQRDIYYGIYALFVGALFAALARWR